MTEPLRSAAERLFVLVMKHSSFYAPGHDHRNGKGADRRNVIGLAKASAHAASSSMQLEHQQQLCVQQSV